LQTKTVSQFDRAVTGRSPFSRSTMLQFGRKLIFGYLQKIQISWPSTPQGCCTLAYFAARMKYDELAKKNLSVLFCTAARHTSNLEYAAKSQADNFREQNKVVSHYPKEVVLLLTFQL
jgi:hypothetical protein